MSDLSEKEEFFFSETFTVPNNLIPEVKPKEGLPSIDSVSVLSRLLKDILCDNKEILHKAENILEVLNPNSKNKEFAEKIKFTYKTYDSLMLDVQRVEARIMKTHAVHLIKENELENNFPLKERLQLKRDQIFMQLRKEDVNRYSLLQAGDLLPDAAERAMDFRLVEAENLNFLSSSRSILQISKPLKKCSTPLKNIVIAAPKTKTKHLKRKEILVANPNCVEFVNCKKGILYEQTVKLKNVSSDIARFNLGNFPKCSNFLVSWTPLPGDRKFIAPGMAASLVIRYQADPYQELITEFKIDVCNGNPVTIKIIVHRIPPILNFSMYVSETAFKPTESDIIQKSKIECGACFIGNCVKTTIPLYNIGGHGRFLICGTEGWSFSEINLTMDNILIIPPFTASPLYFSIDTDENIELCITFLPNEAGVFVEQLVVLCNNCTARFLDLIGDGIMYTKDIVEFVNMEKTFEIDRDDDEACEMWLNLGQTVSNGLVFKSFCVKNKSHVKLNYRWDKRDLKYTVLVKEELFQLPMESYQISPATGSILPKETVTFQVRCQMEAAHSGKYRHALNFVLLDVPTEAITSESGPVVYAGGENEDLVDLIPGQVEIWVSVLEIRAILSPPFISITGDKLRVGKRPIKREIRVTNKSIVSLNVAFEIPVSDPEVVKIKICPNSFVLDVDSTFTCMFTIQAIRPYNFKEKIICKINDGALVLDTIIVGEVWHPKVRSNVQALQFGPVRQGSIATKEFKIKSKSLIPVLWSIKEYSYDVVKRELYNKFTGLSDEFGWLLIKGSSQPIVYNLDTKQPGIFCSLLEVSTFFEEQITVCDFVLVTATVVKPRLAIRAPVDNTAVFTVYDTLYIPQKQYFTITLLNLTMVRTYFEWDTPIGDDVRKLDVAFSPYSGFIGGSSEREIQVTIQPQETGNVSEYYVPCFIEKEPEPAVLSIICKVDSLNVTFHMPKSPYQECFTPADMLNCEPISWGIRGRDINYPWIAKPPKPDSEAGMIIPFPVIVSEELDATSFDGEYITVKELIELAEQEEAEGGLALGQDLPVVDLTEIPPEEEVIIPPSETAAVEEATRQIVHPCVCHGDLDNLERTAPPPPPPCIQRERAEGQMEKVMERVPRDVILSVAPRVLRVVDVDELLPPQPIPPSAESDLGFPRSPVDSIVGWLRSAAVIEVDLPVNTHTSRLFVVRNETPLQTELDVTVSVFRGLEDEEDGDVINETAARLAGVPADKWSARVDRQKGLAVFVKPSRALIAGHGVVPVTVWMYADAWGNYEDTIVCDVRGLPPFLVQLYVRVTGSPIVFPAAPKDRDPVMRFGTVMFDGDPVTRKLRAKNTSSVDVRLAWEVYLTEVDHVKVDENTPFTIKLNAWLLKESSVNSMEVVRKDSNQLEPLIDLIPCYGKPEQRLFQFEPDKVVIPAKTEFTFSVVLNSRYFVDKESAYEHLQAVAIGFVHVHRAEQAQGVGFHRPQGPDTRNLVVHCHTATEKPRLRVHCDQEDLCFKVSAITLFSLPPDKSITLSKMVLLKNACDVPINAQVEADDPFIVTELRTVGVTTPSRITVAPGAALEVYVGCRLNAMNAIGTQELMRATENKSMRRDPYDLSYTHQRDLRIVQVGNPDHVFQLELKVTFPTLRLPVRKLDFGPVVFFQTKRIRFLIENMSDVPVAYSMKVDSKCFVLDREGGVLPPWPQPPVYGGESVSVRFTPDEPGEYYSLIVITTLVPDERQEVIVTGHGTFNEKYCLRGF